MFVSVLFNVNFILFKVLWLISTIDGGLYVKHIIICGILSFSHYYTTFSMHFLAT